MKRPRISIVNSSTFGKYFVEHISSLERFADLSRIDVPIDISAKELVAKLEDAHGIIASVTPKFPAEVLKQLPKLVALFRHGIGCDNVDLKAATELGIRVSRVQGLVERNAVAEYAIALLMSAARYVPQGREAVCNSRWLARSNFIGLEFGGKTFGIIGLGNIGSRSSEILTRGFNAKVLAFDPYIKADRFADFGAIPSSLYNLLEQSDAVLFHCPATAETKRILSSKQFAMMRKGAILVNTCRGELVDESALIEALQSKHLGCYATDVVEGEPIDGNHRLAKLDNVIITPHLGGYTWESLNGMGQTGVDDMISVFQKNENPKELANPKVLNSEFRKWH